MNSMGKIILTIVSASIVITAYPQAPRIVNEFSIQQCLDYAHQHNVQVRNALLDLQIQEQTNKSITAGALPTVSGNGSATDFFKTPVTLVPAEFFGGTPGTYMAVSFQPKYSANASIQLTQTLFDGQVFVGLQARQASLDYYQKNIDITKESISANIHKIYYQLVVGKTQVAQIDANIERAEKLLHDTKAMYENGFQEKLDIDKATVQLTNLQTQKETLLSNLANGYYGLKFLMGMSVTDSLVLTDNFTEEDLKTGVLDDTAYHYEDRNDYQGLEISKKLNQYNVKRYKYSYLPVLSLNASYQKNALGNTYDFFSSSGKWYTTAYAGLSINVPIFSGFSKDANLKKAKLQLQQTENMIDNLKISIDNDVMQARNRFKADLITVMSQKKNMELAVSVYDQTKKKYESGLASNTDLTNAQTDLRVAEANYISAMYDAIIVKVDYLRVIGKLKY